MRRGEIIPSVAAGLALLAGAPGPAHAAGYSEFLDTIEFRGFRAEASYTTDDNVTRAPAGDALRDRMLGVRVSAGGVVPLSTRTRAAVQGYVGTQRFSTYTGLSNNFIGAQGDFSFRPSGEFGAPTYGVFVRTAKEEYESTLRDGYRHAFGLTVQKPVTDRIQLSGALTRNIGDGKSTVFDTRNTSLRGNADWSLGRWDTVYLGADYRRGDAVSTAPLTPGRADIADAVTVGPDDAYNNPALFAYRFKASIWITTLGYNHAFSGGHSLDFSWRWAHLTPLELRGLATASESSYTANQFSAAYLARF